MDLILAANYSQVVQRALVYQTTWGHHHRVDQNVRLTLNALPHWLASDKDVMTHVPGRVALMLAVTF